VPFDVRIGIFGEAGFSIREVKAVFLAMPVALFAPLVTFAGVLPFGPLAEFPVKLVIHSIEGAFGRIGAMVVRPAPDTRVECGDEGGLVAAAMGAGEFFHLFQVTLLRFATGLDDDFVAPFAAVFPNRKLPNGEAEKVKTGAAFVFVERMGDVGFGGFQDQSHFGQPFFNQSAGSQQFLQVFAENDKVICKADDDWSVAFREGFFQGSFETVQSDVRKQG